MRWIKLSVLSKGVGNSLSIDHQPLTINHQPSTITTNDRLLTLKRSLKQTGEPIAIASGVLKEIYQSSHRQLTLIELLLEQARDTTKHSHHKTQSHFDNSRNFAGNLVS